LGGGAREEGRAAGGGCHTCLVPREAPVGATVWSPVAWLAARRVAVAPASGAATTRLFAVKHHFGPARPRSHGAAPAHLRCRDGRQPAAARVAREDDLAGAPAAAGAAAKVGGQSRQHLGPGLLDAVEPAAVHLAGEGAGHLTPVASGRKKEWRQASCARRPGLGGHLPSLCCDGSQPSSSLQAARCAAAGRPPARPPPARRAHPCTARPAAHHSLRLFRSWASFHVPR
jgi:hypothetical protein